MPTFSKMGRTLVFVLLISLTCFSGYCSGHLIDGIFTEPTLELGYNLVATVPRGALALNVTQLRHTENYLAIKLQNGTYFLNGNYNINLSGKYLAAGTTFVYLRQGSQHLESFSAAGPLQESIDVMVLYQEPNPGIVYRYIIPGNGNVPTNTHFGHKTATGKAGEPIIPSILNRRTEGGSIINNATQSPYLSRRGKKRKFVWKAIGYTGCSQTCGGGFQMLKYICVKEHTQTLVPGKRCHTEKPRDLQRCNTTPCPPKWKPGPWSHCSVTCGTGTRTRELECVQEIKPSLVMRIADDACTEPKILPTTETCEMPACEYDAKITPTTIPPPQWNVGTWSSCSTSCGLGKRTRVVTCVTQGPPCDIGTKPDTQEPCDYGPCSPKTTPLSVSSAELEGTQWLYTEWSEGCSSECGTGVQTRKVFCDDTPREMYCDPAIQPETTRTCSSNRTCSGQWFTGPWSECSTQCDLGEQVREAVCVTTLRGSLRLVLDMNCPASKPETRRPCNGPPCESTWFISDWTECSRSCGKGIQEREVKCLNRHGHSPDPHEPHCKEKDKPIYRRACNDYPCKDDVHISENHHRVLQVQDDPEISNVLDENPDCKDSRPNCNLVAQARLCTYHFYQQFCCLSCSRAKQEE